jgi:hypothetical protein
VSVADHTGWAYVVCVAALGGTPAVIERRRVRLIDAGLPTMPYEHESRAMREDEANALIARVSRSIAACARDVLQRLVTELAPYAVVALAIRNPPFPDLPRTVVDVWQSHRLLCSADGMLYQLALCRAARRLGLDVRLCRRGDEMSEAARQLRVTAEAVDDFISRGRPPGPPWTQEHRRAYAAGIAVLAAYARGRLQLATLERSGA